MELNGIITFVLSILGMYGILSYGAALIVLGPEEDSWKTQKIQIQKKHGKWKGF